MALPPNGEAPAETLEKASDQGALWDWDHGRKWVGGRSVALAGCCLVPSLNGELPRLPT